MKNNGLILALIGTGFTFAATAAGSAMVFLFRKDIKPNIQKLFFGFAAGVMIAASVWSLLIPAIEGAADKGKFNWVPAAIGFILGGVFMLVLDKLLPHFHVGTNEVEGMASSLRRTTMIVLAVTLHNIPEGLAVGLSFALAAQEGSNVTLAGAIALSIGMALQNFPEGAAISLPLKNEGLSNTKAFIYGALSGIVEPIAGVIGVILAISLVGVMPWLLSFAAGAMIYVVVEELIPEASVGEHSNIGTVGAMLGFVIMMVLDVALG